MQLGWEPAGSEKSSAKAQPPPRHFAKTTYTSGLSVRGLLAPFSSHACRYIKQMLSCSPAVSSEAFRDLNKLDFHMVNPHSKSSDFRARQLLSWVSLSKQVTLAGAAPTLSKQFRPQLWPKCPHWVTPHNTQCHNPRSLCPQRGEAEVTALWG